MQPALRVVAEASWVTVVYAAAAVIVGKQPPLLGPLELLCFVVAGVVVGTVARGRDMGPVLLIVSVICGGALGWLASPDARAVLPNLPQAFSLHLTGWLAGVAVLRGAFIDTGQGAAEEIEKLLRSVPVGLALIWAYVQFAALPGLWLPFAVTAMWGTVGFLAAAAVSIGLARLNVLHVGLADHFQRRAWRVLVAVIGFGLVPVAVPVGVLSGIPVASLLTPIAGPLQLVLGLLVIPLSLIVQIVTELLRPFAGPLGELFDAIARRNAERQRPLDVQGDQPLDYLATIIGLAMWALTILVLLLAVFYVARFLLRRKAAFEELLEELDPDTEHAIVVPGAARRVGVGDRRRRAGSPRDAVGAYLSALAALDGHPDLARLPHETPARHATRLRLAGVAAASDLARLAAAYQLARYGERRITVWENVRAVGRFQRLRRVLRTTGA